MLLSDVVKRLRLLAPLQLAEKWDNVGLLMECTESKVKNILMTNDLTTPVVQEAVQNQCQMILSYHPPIFKPLKRLTKLNWKERIAVECIQKGISVYSPHTSWDAVSWMINYNIVKSALGLPEMTATARDENIQSLKTLTPHCGSIEPKLTVSTFRGAEFEKHKEAVFNLVADESSFNIVASVNEKNCLQVLSNLNFEEHQLQPSSICEIENTSEIFGCGLIVKLVTSSYKESEIIANVKKLLNINYVRYTSGENRGLDHTVNSIAVCAGSGSSVLQSVYGSVDLVITGEMSHHDVLDAKFNGTSVILTEHSNSERKFLTEFKNMVENIQLLPDCNLIISQFDKEALNVF